jgi:hypothetical protein
MDLADSSDLIARYGACCKPSGPLYTESGGGDMLSFRFSAFDKPFAKRGRIHRLRQPTDAAGKKHRRVLSDAHSYSLLIERRGINIALIALDRGHQKGLIIRAN